MLYREITNGTKIPQMGYGTFMMSSAEVEELLPQAIGAGYRHIDTANAYFNEAAVGRVIAASPVSREELFVTTKLFPCDYPTGRVDAAIDTTLRRLGLDYVDLLLLHQPYGAYVEAWAGLERALATGKAHAIGLSNFDRAKTQEVLDTGTVAPHVMQVEINPRWNQHDLKDWLEPKGTVFEGWYPLGHGDAELLGLPVFSEIGEKHGKSPAQIIERWHLQEGNVIFPKTANPAHMRENLDVFDFELSEEEMGRIAQIPQQAYYTVAAEQPDFTKTVYDYDSQQK